MNPAYPALVLSAVLLAGCTTAAPSSSTAASRPIYTQGQTLPAMETRSPELRPGPIPARVRYVVADDDLMNQLAERLRAGIEARDVSMFDDLLIVLPGAWSVFQKHGAAGLEGVTPVTMLNPGQSLENGGRNGGLVRESAGREAVANAFFNAATADGGFEVSALSTQQMAAWWPYIAFNIEEPVFVVTTEGGRYQLVVDFNQEGKISSMDELNALPKEL